jgi:hypothetical protein
MEPRRQLDLDRDPEGQLGEPHRTAGVPTGVAERPDEQVGAAVGSTIPSSRSRV